MKLDSERLLADPQGTAQPAWARMLPTLAICIALVGAIYWHTALSIGLIWWRSETFAHGFLIVPITLWLVWVKRREIGRIAPAPDALGLVLLAAAAAAWLAASAAQVQVVQQYAMVLMIPAVVIALAGRKVARAAAFPLAFLLLGVPVGEALIPPLMEWTADFTVVALQLTGIPVYREGLFFTIPSGNWSIVEGCSGLRYLIASVTVGVLFAYLNYRKFGKRALFLAAAVAIPIVANGVRAYGIVMIAHLSDMKLALGVDHFIYGWVFFGLVILLLFWVGSFWRDDVRPLTPTRFAAAGAAVRAGAPAGYGVAVLALAASAPVYASFLESSNTTPVLEAPAEAAGWTRAGGDLTGWRPRYNPASASRFETYRKGSHTVAVYVAYYRDQRAGAQLITTANVLVPQKDPVWSNVGEAQRSEDFGVSLRETRLRSGEQRLLAWDWYWISGEHLASPYLGKLYIARDRLLGRGDDGAALILAAAYEERPDAAQAALRQFARDMLPSIEAALSAARRSR